MRPEERAALPRSSRRKLGTLLGQDEKAYVELPREDRPLPLRAIYHLVPADRSGVGAITPTTSDARRLLASTFVLSVRTPQRLRNQLEVCADLARTASSFEAAVNADAGSAELAEAIMDHAGEREGATA